MPSLDIRDLTVHYAVKGGTVQALHELLPELAAQDYRCVTVPELLAHGKPKRKRF